MLCVVCHRAAASSLCETCRASMRPAHDLILPSGLPLIAAFEHSGPAVSLMHEFKYRGFTRYADLVTAEIRTRVPPAPVTWIPRAWSRWIRYGVDPGWELARRLAGDLGVPMVSVFARPIHQPRRAGSHHRRAPVLWLKGGPMPSEILVVDDVVTTGGTVLAAAVAMGPTKVVTAVAANSAVGLSTLRPRRDTPTRSFSS